MITVRVVAEEGGLAALEADWRRLYEGGGNSTPFLSHEWLSTWWRHFGAGKQLCVLAAENGGEVVGIAPLMRVRSAVGTQLRFIGKPLSDYSDFLVEAGQDQCVAALMGFIRAGVRWDALELRGIRGDSPNLHALEDAWPTTATLARWSRWTVAPYVPTSSDWSEYSHGLKKGLRADTQRQIRRLEQQGSLQFREYPVLEEALELLDRFVEQKSRRYRSTGARDIFSNGRILAFYKEAVSRLWDRGQVHISSLDLDHHPVAVHFGFIQDHRYSYYMPSFDDAFSGYSPGRLLLRHLVENSFLRGLSEFDFMNGDEPYKYDWATDECPVYELVAFRRTPRGFALYATEEARRRLRASSLIRRGVRWTRKRAG